MTNKKTKKVSIVIEETGFGPAFNVYLIGDVERLDGKTPEHQLSPAEFWGGRLFALCRAALTEAGVVEKIMSLSKDQRDN